MAVNNSRHGLPSPIPSVNSPAPSNASIEGGRFSLPQARRHPLKPGSPKEIMLINHLDDKVLRITRRYGKKFTEPYSNSDDAPGYTSLDQAITDLDPLLDLAWASGTPTIQIPYLLSFAGLIMSYMAAFPFTTKVFAITKKLDTAFASLLRGDSGDAIRAHPVSVTEKVRIKSLVEETKVIAVNVAASSGLSTEVEEDSEDDEDDMDVASDAEFDDEDISTALAISRMYKSTIEILGDSLVRPNDVNLEMTELQDDNDT